MNKIFVIMKVVEHNWNYDYSVKATTTTYDDAIRLVNTYPKEAHISYDIEETLLFNETDIDCLLEEEE